MFKLRNFKILCTKWAHFKFDACYRSQNSWISSSFQNSLKTSGHRGYEFLEFWCWNLFPFLPDIGFQLLKSLWLSLMHFSFNDAPNVLYRWKIWTAGQFSTRTLLLRSHAVVIAAVCSFVLSCWNTRRLEGNICCSKTFIYLSAFIVPSKTRKLHLCTPIPSEMLAFELNADNMLEGRQKKNSIKSCACTGSARSSSLISSVSHSGSNW